MALEQRLYRCIVTGPDNGGSRKKTEHQWCYSQSIFFAKHPGISDHSICVSAAKMAGQVQQEQAYDPRISQSFR